MADDEQSGARRPDDASPASKRRAPTIDLKQSEYTAKEADAAAAEHSESPSDSASAKSATGDTRQGDGAVRRLAGTAAGAGAVAALIVVGVLWSVGLFTFAPPAPPAPASPGDVVARLTRLEQIAVAAKPEESQPADPVLPARVSALEQSSRTMREQLATLRRQVDTLSSALVELKSARPEAGGSSPGPGNGAALEALRARIDAFDRALREVRASAQASGEAASAERAPSDPLADPRLRRFALALLLDARVRSGVPYQSDLASLKALGVPSPMSPDAFAALDHFAASGIPSQAALADELRQVLRTPYAPSRRSEAALPSAGALGLFDRLSQQAAKLIKIERVDAPQVEADAAVPPALQEAARAGDIDAAMNAIADVDRLPSAMRTPARHWIEKARATHAARAAAQSVLHAAAAPFRAAAPLSP